MSGIPIDVNQLKQQMQMLKALVKMMPLHEKKLFCAFVINLMNECMKE